MSTCKGSSSSAKEGRGNLVGEQRALALESLKESYRWKRLLPQLSQKDMETVESFINSNSTASKDEFVHRLNRMFLDQPNKPRKWALITELLLSVAITAEPPQR